MIISLIVAWIIFIILVNTIKMTVRTALIIAAAIVILQVGYGITLADIWRYIVNLPQHISHLRSQ